MKAARFLNRAEAANAARRQCGEPSARSARPALEGKESYTTRSASIFLISPIACAGFSPFGQVRAQFMMVWQR